MKKATNKILSLALVVMMLLGTFAMMFAYADAPAADTPVTTPKAYDTAADGEKLYDVDFSSQYYTAIDDTAMSYDNNGVTYNDDGVEVPNDPALNQTVDGSGAYGKDVIAFRTGWRKNLTADAVVVEENGAALKIDGKVNKVGEEGQEGYVPEVPSEATAADQRYIGQINAYDLENKTYTYQFEYFRKGIARSKFYFANGTFMNFGGMDHFMPCLGIELNASGFRLMRQSSAITQNVVGKPQYTVDEASGETRLAMKVVLSGGEAENVTLYDGNWLNEKAGVGKWVGEAIPVNYSIYMTITKDNGDVQDIRISTGLIYQPSDVKLVFGIGEYNNPAAGNSYGARNLAVYKGDTSVPFTFGFTKVYAESGWGEELTTFDAKGITNAANNFANGYEWVLQNDTTVDAEGVVTINNPTTARTQGAYTPHPFGDEWNQGYYEMELTVNNASRLKIGLLQLTDLDRVGFNILPNVANADLTTGSADAYLHADAGNAATLWTSGANSFGTGIVENSTTALQGYIKTIVYDTYVADDKTPNPEYDPAVEGSQQYIVDEDTLPDDPRNVRDYGGNRANIKIAYDCENYIITLYEKCGGEWLATSAIDYSEAVYAEKVLGACIDFQAYNAKTNATIKNVRAMKGLSVTELYTYAIGSIESDMYVGFAEGAAEELADMFAEYYGLTGYEYGFTADGATFVEDYSALYFNEDFIDDSSYGPQAIKLAPIVKYEELATSPVIRGVQVKANEDDTYDVRFISAIGDIEGIAKVGYEIEKTVFTGLYAKTTTTTVETDKVFARFNANSLYYEASAIGGEYAVAMGLEDEAVVEDLVYYTVSVYTIAQDGTKTVLDGTTTFAFYEGEYTVWGW